MDKLKKYFKQHLEEMDVDSPPDETWNHIKSRSSGGTVLRRLLIMKYIAAASIVLLAGIGTWLITNPPHPSGKIVQQAPPPSGPVLPRPSGPVLSPPTRPASSAPTHRQEKVVPGSGSVTQAVIKIDRTYSWLINYQLKQLRSTPLYAEGPHYFDVFRMQLRQMDIDEENIRKDIKRYGLSDELLEQLINVYQQKLNVLKNLQTEMNKMNNKVKEKQQPSGGLNIYYLNL